MVTRPSKKASISAEAFYDELSGRYDQVAQAGHWVGPSLAFGLLYKSLNRDQTVADLAVGTGTAATLFAKAGCRVIGLDISQQMLDIAGKACDFDQLHHHDLRSIPYPIATDIIDHTIIAGALYFIDDLHPVLSEVSRIMRDGGHFYFDVVSYRDLPSPGKPELFLTAAGLQTFVHPEEYVAELLETYGFRVVVTCPFFFFSEPAGDGTSVRFHFRAFLCQKKSS
jgi:predicted TPR repeat methyltransferase